jgi:hypothetical protein
MAPKIHSSTDRCRTSDLFKTGLDAAGTMAGTRATSLTESEVHA